MKTLLGFFLLLTQLALSLSYLTSICFNSGVKVLGSRGWVLTVQCLSRVLASVCYRRVDVVSHVVVLFCSFVLVPSQISVPRRTLMRYPKYLEMVTNCVIVSNLQNGSYPSW